MKRFLTSILALLYLALASGAGIEVHHCMGEVVGAALHTGLLDTGDDEAGHHCGKCGMVKSAGQSNGCCKDETKAFDGDDAAFFAGAKKLAAPDAPLPAPALLPAHFGYEAPALIAESPATSGFQAHAPPDPWASGPPVFIRVCCFLI